MVDSIYIHIPFCDHICSYCDFSKVFYKEELVDKYLSFLEKEMAILPIEHKYKTLYIGGGTPSSLSITQLNHLFFITDKILFQKDYEFTIECNIENLTEDKLKLMKQHRVNRLSIGVESFNQTKLDFLERHYLKNRIKPTIKLAREIGFSNINIDLMYAIPGETVDDVKNEVEEALELGIEHISTYSLILEANTKLGNSDIKEIDTELDRNMYDVICQKLKEAGFEHYEISNFALPGYQSKHNLTYWQNKEYYGFGLGASGYIKPYRYQNTKSITQYLKGNFCYEKELQNQNLEIENEIILNFRTKNGINKNVFFKKYGFDLKEKYFIEDFISHDVIIETDEYYYISEDYWYLLNEILLRFIDVEV